eukprot:c12055_g1_i1.p1 GENE.c12055_g1_i1~~c12055_g1_i1.p1  ORF type:complete len:343 (+),score=46.33 c12055_g1_i1:42-1070(+)
MASVPERNDLTKYLVIAEENQEKKKNIRDVLMHAFEKGEISTTKDAWNKTETAWCNLEPEQKDFIKQKAEKKNMSEEEIKCHKFFYSLGPIKEFIYSHQSIYFVKKNSDEFSELQSRYNTKAANDLLGTEDFDELLQIFTNTPELNVLWENKILGGRYSRWRRLYYDGDKLPFYNNLKKFIEQGQVPEQLCTITDKDVKKTKEGAKLWIPIDHKYKESELPQNYNLKLMNQRNSFWKKFTKKFQNNHKQVCEELEKNVGTTKFVVKPLHNTGQLLNEIFDYLKIRAQEALGIKSADERVSFIKSLFEKVPQFENLEENLHKQENLTEQLANLIINKNNNKNK